MEMEKHIAMKTFCKKTILMLLVIVGNAAWGQKTNRLLDRSFWKQRPTIQEIEQSIQEGNSPTEMTSANFDATVYAILEDNPLATVKYLLTQGNAVDKITHDGRTYLMWAAYKGNVEVMQYLVSQGGGCVER